MTSGLSTWACRLVSLNSGSIPMTVVSNIALKRWRDAWWAASATLIPAAVPSLMNSTRRIELLMTTPASETKPIIDGIDKSSPIATCPQIAPTSAMGMAMMTISGST